MGKWIDNFDFTAVIIDANEYIIKPSDILKFENQLNYWHSKGDPSSWLTDRIHDFIKDKYKTVPLEVQQKITAYLLGITVNKLKSSLEWTKNYMAWHG